MCFAVAPVKNCSQHRFPDTKKSKSRHMKLNLNLVSANLMAASKSRRKEMLELGKFATRFKWAVYSPPHARNIGANLIDLGRTQVHRLREKGGVERDIPAHPKMVEHLDAWTQASGITGSASLFPVFERSGTVMGSSPLDRGDALRMVKRRLANAGLPHVFSNHSFRATGITEFLSNGGTLETAQQLANHADSRTTKIYDRRAAKLELEEIVRIRY